MSKISDRKIERRFLYESPTLPSSPEAIRIAQGYVAIDGFKTVGVRTSDTQGIKSASICIKGPKVGAEAP
jgi:CYTH domain-containing protein